MSGEDCPRLRKPGAAPRDATPDVDHDGTRWQANVARAADAALADDVVLIVGVFVVIPDTVHARLAGDRSPADAWRLIRDDGRWVAVYRWPDDRPMPDAPEYPAGGAAWLN